MTSDEPHIDLVRHLPPGSDSDEFVASDVADSLQSARPDIAAPLLEILGEVLDNALTHGSSAAGTMVRLGQAAGAVDLTVADSGIGIRAHLARGGLPTTSHAEAIRIATRPGTTGAHPPRGYGLGRFSSGGDEAFEEAPNTIEGTVITIRVA